MGGGYVLYCMGAQVGGRGGLCFVGEGAKVVARYVEGRCGGEEGAG